MEQVTGMATQLVEAGLEAQRALVRAAAAYAADGTPGGREEDQLREALRRRDDVALRIGLALLEGAQCPPTRVEAIVPTAPATADPPEAVEATCPEVACRLVPDPPAVVEPPDEDQSAFTATEPAVADPPASAAALRTLVQNGLGPKWKDRAPPEASKDVAAALARIGPPMRVATAEALDDEVGRVAKVAEHLRAWKQIPRADQRRLLGLLSAKARYLQDETGLTLQGAVDRLDRAFRRMTAWSKGEQPGWVPGLNREGSPLRSTWWDEMSAEWQALGGHVSNAEVGPGLDDLRAALDRGAPRDEILATVRALHAAGLPWSDPRLVALLTPHASLLAGARDLKTLRTRVKRALAEEESKESVADAAEDLPIPRDWAYYDLTARRRVCIVGGDARAEAQRRIQDTFRFQSVIWERGEPRKVQTLTERIRAGSLDIAFVLREFVSHTVVDAVIDACRDADVPFAVVDKGYGIVQCRLALERYLAPRQGNR